MPEIKYRKDGTPYVHYTKQDKDEAKDISMLDFLSRRKNWVFQSDGHRYYEATLHDSLKINLNEHQWTWYSRGLHGNNAIDWLRYVEGYEYPDAMKILVGSPLLSIDENKKSLSYKAAPKASEIRYEKVKEIKLPQKADGQYKQAFAYLTKTRCIDPDIVSQLFHEQLIYQDIYNNVIFVGKDENDEIRFCERKTTNTFLANKRDENGKKLFTPMNVSGSDKRYSFNIPYDEKAFPASEGILYVFEAPVDLLSHATFRMLNEKITAEHFGHTPNLNTWRNVNRLSLSGVAATALDSYLERNPQINTIVFCLDNDETGIDNAIKYVKRYTERGYMCKKTLPEKGKDWNECLQILLAERNERKSIENTNAALQQLNDNVFVPPKGAGRK